jgi:uncharacterized protein (DUF885 family)
MAILPGQLTSYDSGLLEIMALWSEAQAAMGSRFDVRSFHEVVLENGPVPLRTLRALVTEWTRTFPSRRREAQLGRAIRRAGGQVAQG